MNWDWSKSLMLVMGLFILLIVGMAVKMATSNQALYQSDYYEQGEQHSGRMVKEAKGRQVNLIYNPASGNMKVVFDSIGVVNEVVLRYLSDAQKDRRITLSDQTPSSEKELNFGKLASGLWILEMEGVVNENTFYKKNQFVQ